MKPTSPMKRPLILLAYGLALASLVLMAASAHSGGKVRWTGWAVPLLIMGNLTMMASGVEHRRPRAAKLLWAVSITLAVVIMVAEIRVLLTIAA